MQYLRPTLTAAAAVAMGLSFAATEAAAGSKVEWNLSAWGNPRAVTRGMERFAEYVEEASGGNFTIQIHYGETLSPARQNLDAVSIGAFEMA
jgi:TRAP-type mannitol/chloroaromatic compound transport system substrate-binding protein